MLSLSKLWERGTSYLGSNYAILGGAMSWISEANLVSSISNAGGFGILAAGSMSAEQLGNEIKKTQKLTSATFGVNLIVMHPKLDELIGSSIEAGARYVVLAGGIPTKESIEKLTSANIKVMGFAPSVAVAKRLIKSGVSALIIEGNEAGGHIGNVSTSVLAQEILPQIKEVPVFVAGGIGRGEAIVNYLMMGASGAQLGTKFVCATESIAHANFKQAFINASAKDAQPSVQVDPNFKVIPVRAIINNATKDFMEYQVQVINDYRSGKVNKEDAQLNIENFWVGALKKAAINGDVDNGSLMAGQSVGMVTEVKPTKAIIEELIEQATTYINNYNGK